MNRKIIQIAVLIEGDLTAPGLFALCEDGSLHLFTVGGKTWSEVPPIPELQITHTRTKFYTEGFESGSKGLSAECPYPDAKALDREEWQDGYVRGMRQFKS